MDPVTAIAGATAAFNAIKQAISVGKDVNSMAGDMSRWMNSIQDIKKGHEREKTRKSRFASIEEEALETWAAKKKAEAMENELRQFVNFNYGPSSWQEIIRLQADIRKKQQEEQERLRKERQQIIEYVAAFLLVLGIVCVCGWFIWLAKG